MQNQETTNPGIHMVVTNAWIKKGDKYLVAQRALGDRYKPGYRSIVGGKMEIDKGYNALEENIKKEIIEEVGIQVTNIKIIGNCYFNQDSRKCLYLTFTCERLSGEATALEDTENIARLTLEEIKTFEDPNLFDLFLPFII